LASASPDKYRSENLDQRDRKKGSNVMMIKAASSLSGDQKFRPFPSMKFKGRERRRLRHQVA